MFLFEVKRLIWSALDIEFSELYFLKPLLGGDPVLSGHLAISRGWLLKYAALTVILIASLSIDFNKEYMLQVNPTNRPDIREVLTGLEAIAIAMDVDLKGNVVM